MGRSLKSKRAKHLNTLKRDKLSVIMSERARKHRAEDAENAHRKIVPSSTVNGRNWREYIMHLNSTNLAPNKL